MKDLKIPDWATGPIGKYIARPIYFRLLSDYRGAIDFGSEHLDVSGETIIEYMVFGLRRGQVPDEKEYIRADWPSCQLAWAPWVRIPLLPDQPFAFIRVE